MPELLLTVLRLSLHGALIALAVLLLRLILKKAPKALIVALWGLAALRLILPFTVEFKHSAVPEAIGDAAVFAQWSEQPVGEYETFYEGQPEYREAQKAGRLPRTDGEGKQYVIVGEDRVSAPRTVKEALLPLFFWLWLAGAAGMLLYMAFSYGRLHSLTADAVRERENVYRSEKIASPFLLGVVRPRICLPVGLQEPEYIYVVAHEKAHIARGDHWWKAIGFWILCIHWFNPVLWAAYLLFCRDIEYACDAHVASRLPKEQLADYSQALLNCSLHQKRPLPCPLSFAETGIRERVKKILGYRKAGKLVCAAAILGACACAVFFMTGSPQEMQQAAELYQPPETTLPVAEENQPVWMAAPAYPDEKRFFAQDRELDLGKNSLSWEIRKAGETKVYTLVHDRHSLYPAWKGSSLSVTDTEGNQVDIAVMTIRLENADLLACDGRYAYLREYLYDGGQKEQLVRLDLKTKRWEVLREAESFPDIRAVENVLLYYLVRKGDTVRVCRMYLPEGTETEFEMFTASSDFMRLELPRKLSEAPVCNSDQVFLETEPVTEPTAEPTAEPSISNPDRPWLVERKHPDYTTYRWNNEIFDGSVDPVSWQGVGERVTYTLIHDGAPGNPGQSLSVRGSDGTVYENVFRSTALSGGRLLCCDGRYAWFCQGWDGGESYRRISRVDLKTGEETAMAEAEKIWDVWVMEGMVLYYLTFDGECTRVCYMYLPEGEEVERYTMYLPERLETEDGTVPVVPEMLVLTPPATRNGNPSWELTAEGVQ